MFVNHAHVMPASTREDGTVDSLARLMDQFGFEGAVCFAPFIAQTCLETNGWIAPTFYEKTVSVKTESSQPGS